VQGPTNVKVTTQTTCKTRDAIEVGKLQFFTDKDGQEVGLGLGTQQSVGILFCASATMPSGGNGQFIWVQIVIRDERSLSDTNKGLIYPPMRSTGGLDPCTPERCGTPEPTYQYDTGPITADSPSQKLGSGNDINQMSRYFEANMYLMWQADTNSIPVPLGIVHWYTYWYVTFVPSRATIPGAWKIWTGYVVPNAFVPSIIYPEWNGPNKDVP
jgi:hypothetical protein